MKTIIVRCVLLLLSFGAASSAVAQTTPFCATSAGASVLFISPTGALFSSNTETLMALRQFFGTQPYDFVPQNVVVSGFQITLNAPSRFIPSTMVPYTFGSLGVLPAGTYSIVVTPIATNVTPNMICPSFTVPLVVPQGFVNVPVPSTSGVMLALLALCLGVCGLLGYRRQGANVV